LNDEKLTQAKNKIAELIETRKKIQAPDKVIRKTKKT